MLKKLRQTTSDTHVPYAEFPSANNTILNDSQYKRRMKIAENTNKAMIRQKKDLIWIAGGFVVVVGGFWLGKKILTIKKVKVKGEEDRKTADRKKQNQLEIMKEKEKIRIEKEQANKKDSMTYVDKLLGDGVHPIDKYLQKYNETTPEEVDFNSPNQSTLKGSDFGYIRIGGITNLFSPPGIGKTTLAVESLIAYSEGKCPTCIPSQKNIICNPQRAIIFASEKEIRSVRNKLNGYQVNHECFSYIKNASYTDPILLLNDICKRLQGTTTDTILAIDNITSIIPNTLQDADVKKFMSLLQLIIEDYAERNIAISFLLLHHTNKEGFSKKQLGNEVMKGSSLWNTLANSTYALSYYKEGMRILRQTKQRDGIDRGDTNFLIKIEEKPYVHFKYVGIVKNDGVVVDLDGKSIRQYNQKKTWKRLNSKEKNKIIELTKQGLHPGEIARKLNRNRDTISDFISKMKKQGKA